MNGLEKAVSYLNEDDFCTMEIDPILTSHDMIGTVEDYPFLSQAFLKALTAIGSKCPKLKSMIKDN
jgi:hypothetical protein